MADNKTWGLLAQFDNPARLLEAAQSVKGEGYSKFETWTPFPIHGMDDAMGLGGSKVPWISLAGGISGLSIGVGLQWWSGTVAYPLIVGGKPLFAWEFGMPVMFELTILLAAFGAVFGMFALNRLPTPFHPLDRVAVFKKATDDGFFLSIEAKDAKFDLEGSKALLEKLGGTNITLVEE
jgi:hypothetical protein